MMRRILRWWLPGLLLYLLFLIAALPAAQALHWFGARLPINIHLNGVSGTLWSGRAATVDVDGVPLGTVHWSFDWRAPWSGGMGYHVTLVNNNTRLRAEVVAHVGNRIVIHALTGQIPLARLDHWLPLPEGSIGGLLQLDISTLGLLNELPISASGQIHLRDTQLHWPQTAALGDYTLTLTTDKDGIRGRLRDDGGPLQLGADVLLQASGRYHVQGNLAVREPASAAAHLLATFGVPGKSGQWPLTLSGQLH